MNYTLSLALLIIMHASLNLDAAAHSKLPEDTKKDKQKHHHTRALSLSTGSEGQNTTDAPQASPDPGNTARIKSSETYQNGPAMPAFSVSFAAAAAGSPQPTPQSSPRPPHRPAPAIPARSEELPSGSSTGAKSGSSTSAKAAVVALQPLLTSKTARVDSLDVDSLDVDSLDNVEAARRIFKAARAAGIETDYNSHATTSLHAEVETLGLDATTIARLSSDTMHCLKYAPRDVQSKIIAILNDAKEQTLQTKDAIVLADTLFKALHKSSAYDNEFIKKLQNALAKKVKDQIVHQHIQQQARLVTWKVADVLNNLIIMNIKFSDIALEDASHHIFLTKLSKMTNDQTLPLLDVLTLAQKVSAHEKLELQKTLTHGTLCDDPGLMHGMQYFVNPDGSRIKLSIPSQGSSDAAFKLMHTTALETIRGAKDSPEKSLTTIKDTLPAEAESLQTEIDALERQIQDLQLLPPTNGDTIKLLTVKVLQLRTRQNILQTHAKSAHFWRDIQAASDLQCSANAGETTQVGWMRALAAAASAVSHGQLSRADRRTPEKIWTDQITQQTQLAYTGALTKHETAVHEFGGYLLRLREARERITPEVLASLRKSMNPNRTERKDKQGNPVYEEDVHEFKKTYSIDGVECSFTEHLDAKACLALQRPNLRTMLTKNLPQRTPITPEMLLADATAAAQSASAAGSCTTPAHAIPTA